MIRVITYGDTINSKMEEEDTKYVIDELKKSQESLQNLNRYKVGVVFTWIKFHTNEFQPTPPSSFSEGAYCKATKLIRLIRKSACRTVSGGEGREGRRGGGRGGGEGGTQTAFSRCGYVDIHTSIWEKCTIYRAKLDRNYTQCGTREREFVDTASGWYLWPGCVLHFNLFFFFFFLPPVECYLYAAVECKYSYARVRVFLAHRV